MSLKKIKKALTMVLTASVALSAAGCGKDVAKNNMTEEKTVETTVQESSSETISDDTKTTETAQYAMERSETESTKESETSVYKGYKRDKIEMRGDRAEMSDFPLYLNTVAGGLDRRDQTIGGFSFVVKIYAVPVVEIIGGSVK